MHAAHVTREPCEAERVRRDDMDLVAFRGEDRGHLPRGETRTVGEQHSHGCSFQVGASPLL